MSRLVSPPLRIAALSILLAAVSLSSSAYAAKKPNVVVIFTDDQGWGDLGVQGHPNIKTPNLDRMAAEGIRFTEFYVAAAVCTPSRAALMTGRYPQRVGLHDHVLFPHSLLGLPDSEITIPEILKEQGYATGMVGKWHLGHRKPFLPTNHGFDSYYGIPYSNDMDGVKVPGLEGKAKIWNPKIEYWRVPLLRDTTEIERPVDQTTITRRYTEEAVKFIKSNRRKPFFLYLAHSMPHIPLFRSKAFVDHSVAGLYGDVIEEVDWSVGQILDTIRKAGLSQRTLVIFTSDNGPWLSMKTHGGSAGLLRQGKGSTWEGGMRVPGIWWYPGKIKAGRVSRQMASTLDILPTVAKLAGATPPHDRPLDGFDLAGHLFRGEDSPRKRMHYHWGGRLHAIREGRYKAHYRTMYPSEDKPSQDHDPPLLYDLQNDPSEMHDIAKDHPEVLQKLQQAADEMKESLGTLHNYNASRTHGNGEITWINRNFVFDGKRPLLMPPLDNWKAPRDYYNGTIHQRIIVKKNKNRVPVWLELIFWNERIGDKNHDCLRCLIPKDLAREGSTYTCTSSPAVKDSGWGEGCRYGTIDYEKPIGAIQLGAKYTQDGYQRKRKMLEAPDTPFEFHYTVVLVPAGQKFSGWEKHRVR